MKNKFKITLALALLAIAITTSGCIGGPFYGNKSQYDKGRWHWWADNRSVYERDQQMLAVGKLQAQPVMVGTMTATGVVANVVAPASGKTAPAGYMGYIANNNQYRRYNLSIRGVESRDFYLAPGQRITAYLLPGRYIATIDYGGTPIGRPYIFDVGPSEKNYLGEPCHWYLVAGDRW